MLLPFIYDVKQEDELNACQNSACWQIFGFWNVNVVSFVIQGAFLSS
jgi:hypothetical protein